LDCGAGFAQRGGELVVGLWPQSELLQDERSSLFAVEHVHALVVRKPALELLALFGVQDVDAELAEAFEVSPAINWKFSTRGHIFTRSYAKHFKTFLEKYDKVFIR